MVTGGVEGYPAHHIVFQGAWQAEACRGTSWCQPDTAQAQLGPVQAATGARAGVLNIVACVPRCRCVSAAQYVSDVLDVTYARCGVTEMDKQVEEAIENFTHSLTPVGPDLSRGTIVLAFFEKRKRYYFGVAKSTENVYWEQWSVPVIVNHRPRTAADNEVAGTCAPACVDRVRLPWDESAA